MDMFRAVAYQKAQARQAALGLPTINLAPESTMTGIMVSIRGHEIRSAKLQGGGPLQIEAGETVQIVAVGDAYSSWEGGKPKDGGPVKVGTSYELLVSTVKPKDVIMLDDGSLRVEVVSVDATAGTVTATALNAHELREMTLMDVPNAYANTKAVVGAHDGADIKQAIDNEVDYITVPFVRSAADVKEVSVARLREWVQAGVTKLTGTHDCPCHVWLLLILLISG